MPFVAARCPQCGGELQLDNTKESGFCMHCGSKIVVFDAIQAVKIDNSHLVANWMKLGLSAHNAGNHQEAYEYFTKVVEVDTNNWEAFFFKGRAAGWQSSVARPRFSELFEGIRQAIAILEQNNTPEEQKNIALNRFAETIYWITDAFYDLVTRHLDEKEDLYVNDFDFMWDTRRHIETCISYQEIALSLLDGLKDELSTSNRLEIKKQIAEYCHRVCQTNMFWTDYSQKELGFFGYSAKDKKRYVDKYDDIVIEVRRTEPDFRCGEYSLIDRLDAPRTREEYFSRSKLLLRSESEVDAIYKQKEVAYQQKYWDEHPDEYQAFLAEEQRKREDEEQRKLLLKNDLDAKQELFERQSKPFLDEINQLNQERKSLGIFALKQKKEIESRISRLTAKIEELRISCGLADALEKYNQAGTKN